MINIIIINYILLIFYYLIFYEFLYYVTYRKFGIILYKSYETGFNFKKTKR